MKRSLVWRIAVPFILLVLLSVGGISLYFSNYIEKLYFTNLHDNLQSAAQLLAYDAGSQITAGKSYSALEPLFQTYSDQTTDRITFIRKDGVVTIDSLGDPQTMDNHLTRPEVQTALNGGIGVEIRFSDTLKQRYYYLAVPVVTEGSITAVVRVARELTEIENAIDLLRNQILTIGILTILVSILLAFLVAESTLRPLRKLASKVQQLKENDTSVELLSNRRDEIGQLSRSFSDIADQLNAQVFDFREERSKLEAVLRHMTDAVLIVNADGQVTLANPAAGHLFNTSPDQAVGKSLVEVVRQYQFVDLWRSAIETDKQQVATLETSPEKLFVQGIATPLKGSLPGSTLLVFQDLTRIRRLETVRRDFVANASHELRTPLASLKALTETLQTGAIEDPPAARRFLMRMETEIDNMTQLVQEFLDLSRIESGRVVFNRVPVDPMSLIIRAVDRIKPQAERGGLTIEIEEKGTVPEVLADADRIESVLINLMHNSIKYTPPGGKITASVYEISNEIVFSVHDTGVGIESKDIDRIFERFYKADQSRSGGGTGLGLSIARHTVEAHGGRIWAESVPSQGSTFYFSLPQV